MHYLGVRLRHRVHIFAVHRAGKVHAVGSVRRIGEGTCHAVARHHRCKQLVLLQLKSWQGMDRPDSSAATR